MRTTSTAMMRIQSRSSSSAAAPLTTTIAAVTMLLVLGNLTVATAAARGWRDVVDPGMYQWIDFDLHKRIVTSEKNYFTKPNKGSPTSAPTSNVQTSHSNVLAPTASPTLAPTAIWGLVEKNGNCPMDEVLHEIRMTDSWGDGWDETTLTITRMVKDEDQTDKVTQTRNRFSTTVQEIVTVREPVMYDRSYPDQVFSGSLEDGIEGFAYVCLRRDQCYEVATEGGLWPQEVAWGIRQVELGVPRTKADKNLIVAKGEAPETCQLSVPDAETGERFCPVTCGARTNIPTASPSTARPTTRMPTAAPSFMPTGTRNIAPNSGPSPPATVSSVPSDAPSLVPTNVPSFSLESTVPDDQAQDGVTNYQEPGANTNVQEVQGKPASNTAVPSDAPSLVPTGAPSPDTNSNGLPSGVGFSGFGGNGGFGGV